MLSKPSSCGGCPLFGDGTGFVGDEIVGTASVYILGQNPGADEEREGRPFVGETGQAMERNYFPLAGLERGKVSIGNVLRCRYHHHNDLPDGPTLVDSVAHCTREHLRIPDSTHLVVAQGHLAWELSTGQLTAAGRSKGVPLKVTDWRGFLAPGHRLTTVETGGGSAVSMTRPPHGARQETVPERSQTAIISPMVPSSRTSLQVYGVLHLSDRNKDNQQVFAARKDWSKIPQILSGAWPLPISTRVVLTQDSQWGEVENWFHTIRQQNATIYCDTEYLPDGKMTVLGLGTVLPSPTSNRQDASCQRITAPSTAGLQISWLASPVSSWVRAKLCNELQRTVHEVPTVFHNAVADIPILEANMGVAPDSYFRVEDTMLAHSCLWSELPHDLEFLASIYGQYPKLKHLNKLAKEIRKWDHTNSQQWSRSTDIEKVLKDSMSIGATRCSPAMASLLTTMRKCLLRKTESVQSVGLSQRNDGSVSITSTKQVEFGDFCVRIATICLESSAKTQDEFGAWRNILANELELLYNYGDVLATIDVWTALQRELHNDAGSRGVYQDQLIKLIPILLESQAHGLRVNRERVAQAEVEYTRIIRDSLDRVAVFTGWPTNLGSSTQLCAYLYGERGYPKDRGKQSADDANIHRLRQHVGPAFDPEDEERRGGLTLEEAIERTEGGGDPVLELRAVYSGALQCLSHYIEPCLGASDGRVYPRFATHTQACGRWSTTGPPLAQLPDFLRDIICPDPGEAWIAWDWSNIEPRLKQAYT